MCHIEVVLFSHQNWFYPAFVYLDPVDRMNMLAKVETALVQKNPLYFWVVRHKPACWLVY